MQIKEFLRNCKSVHIVFYLKTDSQQIHYSVYYHMLICILSYSQENEWVVLQLVELYRKWKWINSSSAKEARDKTLCAEGINSSQKDDLENVQSAMPSQTWAKVVVRCKTAFPKNFFQTWQKHFT